MKGELAAGAPKQIEANGDGVADTAAPVAEKPQAGDGL